MGKKGGSSAPDVTGAAKIEGQFARETARDVTYADRPDQYNPFGSVTWDQKRYKDPGTGKMVTKWQQQQNLNVPSQRILDANLGLTGERSALAESLMGRVDQEMGGAPDWAQFGGVQGMDYDPTDLRNRAENAAYQRSANRLDPRFQKERESTDIRLRNQGLRPGDQAYDAQIESFNTGKNDAYEQARLAATGEGRQEAGQLWNQQLAGNERSNALRNQQIEEYIAKRGYTLNEVEGLTQGQTLNDLVGTFGGGGSV